MSDLPIGWSKAKVGDLGNWVGGGTPSKAEKAYWNGQIPWISPKDMKVDVIRTTIDGITTEAVKNSAANLIPEGAVVVVTRSGILAHTFPVATTSVEATLNQDLKALTPGDGIDPTFVAWALRGSQRDILNTCSKDGTTVASIEMQSLSEYELALPPTNEQHRIVAKIEELFSELDKGVESLVLAREQLKLYRQSVLKHAFEGKLTADWREANPDKLEDPETLLTRIQEERDARYKQRLDEWNDAVAEWRAKGENVKKPAKPRRTATPPPISEQEAADICALPSAWEWARPGHLASSDPYAIGIGPFGSNLKVPDYRTSGVPLVFVKNITRDNFLLDRKFVEKTKAAELRAHTTVPGDILITKMGDPPGDCTIYPENCELAVITADCLKFRVWKSFLSTRFYNYMLKSNLVRKQLGLITRGVAQKKISVERFKTVLLPLPCKREQVEVVNRLEDIFSRIEEVEKTIVDDLKRNDVLRQSILKQAFSGQLVPQDPTDEPASDLLARIKATAEPNKKTKRRRSVA